ncbi:MAG TPA: peptidoglycan DD-metalloendopeptidase family protein [Candidatus Saccharimonadales bacterium]|nr:peptidoglycan DD-metalloendopeptidase family protein [Candidatus Saccharimonadales bacterium]
MPRRVQQGFSVVELTIVALVLLLIAGSAFVMWSKQRTDKALNGTHVARQAEDQGSVSAKPQLERWPVAIDDLNSDTKLAGDVYMDDLVLLDQSNNLAEQPVVEFGRSAHGAQAPNNSIDFLTKPDAPVYAAAKGYVLDVTPAQAAGDYNVQISMAKTTVSEWMVTYTHLTAVTIKKGDTVQPGDRIGTAAPYGNGQPFSIVGLAAAYKGKPYCPSGLIAPKAVGAMKEQFLLLTKAWEAQSVNGGAYNEPAWTQLGCVADSLKI